MDETGYLDNAYYQISFIYYQYLNDKDLAIRFINKAIEINPADKIIMLKEQKLNII